MFQNYLNLFWKVELTIFSTINLINDDTKYGINEIVFKKNEPPQNGSCLVSPLSGIELKTNFTVTCLNWFDPDGYISAYEFYCKLLFNSFKNFKKYIFFFQLF